MESRDIILRPVVTEATMATMDDKRYTFDVDVRATKTQVKHAIEDIFDVKVVKVNVMNLKGKKKRQGRYEATLRSVVRPLSAYLPTQKKSSYSTKNKISDIGGK